MTRLRYITRLLVLLCISLGAIPQVTACIEMYFEHQEAHSYVLEESEESNEKEKSGMEDDLEQEQIVAEKWNSEILSHTVLSLYPKAIARLHSCIFLEQIKPPPRMQIPT